MYNLTVLSNNTAFSDFKSEHGLSLLLEIGNEKILFDTGHKSAFKKNIKKLGINLNEINYLVISHGHYDHGGNISYVLRRAKNIETFMHPDAVKERFSIYKNRDPKVKSVGLPNKSVRALKKHKFISTISDTNVGKSVHVTGEIPRLKNETTSGSFYFDEFGKNEDIVIDDQSLWFKDEDGLVIITGCCHSGIINTIKHIQKISGVNTIKTIIGGLHLKHANKDQLLETIRYFNKLRLKSLYPGHCTGEYIIKLLKEELNCPVYNLSAGSHFKL